MDDGRWLGMLLRLDWAGSGIGIGNRLGGRVVWSSQAVMGRDV